MADDVQRIRTLLLRADNLLKSADPGRYSRVRETLTEAASLAQAETVDARVRELIERRLAALDGLERGDGTLG